MAKRCQPETVTYAASVQVSPKNSSTPTALEDVI
jgi:hypothetical protein